MIEYTSHLLPKNGDQSKRKLSVVVAQMLILFLHRIIGIKLNQNLDSSPLNSVDLRRNVVIFSDRASRRLQLEILSKTTIIEYLLIPILTEERSQDILLDL